MTGKLQQAGQRPGRLLILTLLAAGGYALYTIPVEAFPDLTNNQVVVVTDAPSLPPTE